MYEAAQAHLYGLPANKALQSVTTTPAVTAGFGHRLGYVRPGYDADIVVWDSRGWSPSTTASYSCISDVQTTDPLSLGATPRQVFIDGIPQLSQPVVSHKPEHFLKVPKTPSWDKEAQETIKHRGLPPLRGHKHQRVAFTNIGSIWERDDAGALAEVVAEHRDGVVMFVDGEAVCSSFREGRSCLEAFDHDVAVVDLEGGCLSPGLTSFGGLLGLVEIELEPSTHDGDVYGPFDKEFAVVGDLVRAEDGLSFDGRHML